MAISFYYNPVTNEFESTIESLGTRFGLNEISTRAKTLSPTKSYAEKPYNWEEGDWWDLDDQSVGNTKILEDFEITEEMRRRPNAAGGRIDLKPGGLVEPGVTHYATDDKLGDFIYEKTRDGNKYYELEVRKMKKGKREVLYRKSLKATPENLKLLQDIRAEKFSDLIASKISNEKYLELRNLKKDLSNKEFAKYLNTKTNYKPIGDNKWTNINVKGRNQIVGFESDVYRISDDVKKSVFADYQKQVKAGKTNLRELARTHFPDSSIPLETRQKRIYSILTKDYGVDRSAFKTEFDPESKYRSKQKVRFKRNKTVQDALDKAGKVTKAQYLKLEAQILDLNKNILNMSDQEILNNKTLMRALNVDASVENLNKGKITFDKYAHLSNEDQVAKIRQLAKANTFIQPEHVTEVATAKQSIVYPENLRIASGKIGSYMNNIKTYVQNNPNGKAIPAIKNFLNEFNLTVREGGQNLGVKNIVYDSKTGTSNIVDMASTKIQRTPLSMKPFDFIKKGGTNVLSGVEKAIRPLFVPAVDLAIHHDPKDATSPMFWMTKAFWAGAMDKYGITRTVSMLKDTPDFKGKAKIARDIFLRAGINPAAVRFISSKVAWPATAAASVYDSYKDYQKRKPDIEKQKELIEQGIVKEEEFDKEEPMFAMGGIASLIK